MKTRHKILSAIATFAIATFATGAWAAGPTECSLIGTWAGNAGGDMAWVGTHTAGTSNAKGEMALQFLAVSPGLLGEAMQLTPAHGAWEQYGSKGTYAYTWYTYGLDADGIVVYTVKVSGYAMMDGCNTVNIAYLYQVFEGTWPPQDVSGEPGYQTSGNAVETRVTVNVPAEMTP